MRSLCKTPPSSRLSYIHLYIIAPSLLWPQAHPIAAYYSCRLLTDLRGTRPIRSMVGVTSLRFYAGTTWAIFNCTVPFFLIWCTKDMEAFNFFFLHEIYVYLGLVMQPPRSYKAGFESYDRTARMGWIQGDLTLTGTWVFIDHIGRCGGWACSSWFFIKSISDW